MPEPDDMQLLAEYARNNSQPAFATLVQRHINLVYTAALRHVHDPHQAQDVTQAVFIILAQKAHRLRRETVLSGWLYHTARLTSASFRRGEVRRERREQAAFMQATLNHPQAEAGWETLAAVLDDAMARLGEKERNAIVLRFFEGRTVPEVATALALNEPAAKKRVTRALDKLRKFFVKRGIIVSTTVLAGAIGTNAVQAAPAGMAASVATVAAAKGAAAGVGTLALIKATLKLMALAKLKIAAAVVGGVLLAAGTTAVIIEQTQAAAGGPISGRVVLPDGKPAVGVTVYLCVSNEYLDMDPEGQLVYRRQWGQDGELHEFARGDKPISTQTDADGQFSFAPRPQPACLATSDGNGYTQTATSNYVNGTPVVLQPLATVSGTLFVGTKPAADKKVRLKPFDWANAVAPWPFGRVQFEAMAMKTDASGHFKFKVPAGDFKLGQDFGTYKLTQSFTGSDSLTQTTPLRVKSGESISLQLGGVGRTVTGRVLTPDGKPLHPESVPVYLTKVVPEAPSVPEKMDPQDAWEKLIKPWVISPEGKAAAWARRQYILQFGDDGAFKIQDVPPGEYQLHVPLTKWINIKQPGGGGGASQQIWVADAAKTLTIETTPAGQDPDANPLDLGTLQMKETPENLQYLLDHGLLVTNRPSQPFVRPRGAAAVPPDPQDVAALDAQIKSRQSAKTTSGETTIDLYPYTNAKLNEPLSGDTDIKDNTLGELRGGVHIFGGVPFNVRGIIQLGSSESASFTRPVPEEVKDIKIAHKFAKLHLLHAALNGAGPRYHDTVAKLVLHYADGSQAELPVGTYGLEALYQPVWLAEMPQDSELAWIGNNPYLKEYKPRFALHLYRTTLQNPKPDLEVASIDYVSAMTSAAPLMAGLTIE
jgi:RNA polymerase sigma factor (sigma-70 family)